MLKSVEVHTRGEALQLVQCNNFVQTLWAILINCKGSHSDKKLEHLASFLAKISQIWLEREAERVYCGDRMDDGKLIFEE